MLVKDFEELDVYQSAIELQQKIFELSKGFPREEMYALTDQIRRSSRSIGQCIAEAWGKRRYPAHFTSKLTDADAEQLETRHWLKTALLCKYVSQNHFEELTDKCKRIGTKLGSMMRDAKKWSAKF